MTPGQDWGNAGVSGMISEREGRKQSGMAGQAREYRALGDTSKRSWATQRERYAQKRAQEVVKEQRAAGTMRKPQIRRSGLQLQAVTGLADIEDGFERYLQETFRRCALACADIARLLQNYAIANHPWQNQTWATTLTTLGSWEQVADAVFEIALSAGMAYDVFLELARDGRWAWLWPAVEANQREIMATLRDYLSVSILDLT